MKFSKNFADRGDYIKGKNTKLMTITLHIFKAEWNYQKTLPLRKII